MTGATRAPHASTPMTHAYRDGDIAVEVAEVAVAEPAGAAFHYSDGR